MRVFFSIMLALFISAMLAGIFTHPANAQPSVNVNDPRYTIPSYQTTEGVSNFLQRFFIFLIGLVGVSAFLMISWGGFQYATSSANPATMSAAKDKIWGALFGLALAAGSVIILQLINPDLVNLRF